MDETSFWRHIECMKQAEVLGVDTETTGIENIKDGRHYLTGISVAYRLGPLGIVSAYFPFRHVGEGNLDKEYLPPLKAVLESKPLVFHNLKFDLHSLRTIGIYPTGKLYCTMNIAHMNNEEEFSKELDYLSKKYLNDKKAKDELDKWTNLFGWETVPASIMEEYAKHDAELALKLFEHPKIGWPRLKEQELIELWPIERRFIRLLFDMEQRGVRVNQEYAAVMAAKGRDRMVDILDQLDVDEDTLGPTVLKRLLIDELGYPVHHVSEKTGKPSFDKKAMEFYDTLMEASQNPLAQLVLEYRGWQKATTSLYEPLLRLVSPDGRVRPNFKSHGTVTGRLSCSVPNLQQIPRGSEKPWNGKAKRCFDASDGFELWGYDFAQLEFRLATAYGRDTWLVECFNDPSRDVFTELSERIGVERFWVKHGYVYPTLYGAGERKIALTLGSTPDEIRPNYEAFKESIAGIRAVSQQATHKAESNGYVRYWTGRRRHFGMGEGYHKAFNSILQGGAAELVKRAMIDIDENVCDDNCRMVLQVHDEIVFEIRKGMREIYEPEIMKRMVNFPEFGVALKVEGKLWNQ